MKRLMKYIKELTSLDGTPGDEGRVREYIINEIKDDIDSYEVDGIGNLIVYKKGKKPAKNKVMFSAHMDEVGFIITGVEENGLIRFTTLGGIDTRSFLGERVRVGEDGHIGIIGLGAAHLTKEEEIPEPDTLKIDMGFTSKEEAEKYAHIGCRAYFDSDYVEFGDDRVKAKALDDRAGCAIMMDIIKNGIDHDLYFVFGVQEEVGLRGAGPAAYAVNPDYAIVVETTTAADIAGIEGEKRACIQGEGAVVPFADGTTLYNTELVKLVFDTAKEIGVKAQHKTLIAGGTDAGAIHQTRGGIKVSTISMPCRYIHSPSSMLKKSDIFDTRKLVEAVAYKFATR